MGDERPFAWLDFGGGFRSGACNTHTTDQREAMTWTTDTPTKPGWYWWRSKIPHTDFWTCPTIRDITVSALLNDNLWGQWAGPIPEPEEG